MNVAQKVGKNLKTARLKNSFSQLYVEMNSFLTQPQISRFENGTFEADYQTLLFFCKFYNVTMNELFDVEEY